MPLKKGAIVTKKGKFFVVNLVMAREGAGKTYTTLYGTYLREKEAKTKCLQNNKILSCDLCPFKKDCEIY